MNVLTWFDNRTILAVSALLATMFGLATLMIHRVYPSIRGALAIAIGFLLAVPATLLIAARGLIPDILSVVVGNVLVYICYFLVFLGLHFYFGQKDRIQLVLAWITLITGSCAHLYYSAVDDRIVPRILVVAMVSATLRLLMVVTLAQNTQGYLHRRLFITAMLCFALLHASRIPLTLHNGAPRDYMRQNAVQTYNLLLGVVTISIDGLCFVTLLTFEITRSAKQRALQDSLTGVLNRRAIENKLEEEIARGGRTGRNVTVLLLDLDYFKQINDTNGHAAGDTALKLVATTISQELRPFDTLGRFGGDEFLLILPELQLAEALARGEALRGLLAAANAPTLSIGLAQCDPGEASAPLLARADQALYRAKADGRDCIRFSQSSVSLPRPLVSSAPFGNR